MNEKENGKFNKGMGIK